MTATLIGSRAIAASFPSTYPRDTHTADWDFFAPEGFGFLEPTLGKIDRFWDDRLGGWGWGAFATPDELYTIKVSHAFWEINRSPENWNKHAYDIIFLERQGCQLIRPLYDILRPIWKERHGRREVNLAQSKDNFFSDNVVRKFDHDSLHLTIAYYPDQPLYERLLKPGSEVDCSWDQFCELDHNDRIKLCREEVYVTALERILVPTDYKYSARRAYHWALRRTITSLFKNEWALFCAMNLDELFAPDVDYRALHLARADKLILLED